MKKRFLFITIAAALLVSACSQSVKSDEDQVNGRIQGKGNYMYKGVNYQIIEVDGIEYVTNYHGGIYPLTLVAPKQN